MIKKSRDWFLQDELPFRIRLVGNRDELLRCLKVRKAGYARHFGIEQVPGEDEFDSAANTYHLLAEDDVGRAVGTLRLTTWPEGSLEVMKYTQLPRALLGDTIAEGTRMAVLHDRRFHRLLKFLSTAEFEIWTSWNVNSQTTCSPRVRSTWWFAYTRSTLWRIRGPLWRPSTAG